MSGRLQSNVFHTRPFILSLSKEAGSKLPMVRQAHHERVEGDFAIVLGGCYPKPIRPRIIFSGKPGFTYHPSSSNDFSSTQRTWPTTWTVSLS